ncbi:MAG: minor capsid protein [Turicibacter sp.]|nr:minor capsid protein [Turicibacter sp.]
MANTYPVTQENACARLNIAVMQMLKNAIDEELAIIAESEEHDNLEEYKAERLDGLDMDSLFYFFKRIERNFNRRARNFGFYEKLHDIADGINRRAERKFRNEWRKLLGIDITKDRYNGKSYQNLLNFWTTENANLIKTLPKDTLGEMQRIVQEKFTAGVSPKELRETLQEVYNVNKERAEFWARDQVAKLNGQITQKQHQDAGVTKYKWQASMDSRTRADHRALHNTIHQWDDPPIVDTKSGRRHHPGGDYRCRCVAIPIFD